MAWHGLAWHAISLLIFFWFFSFISFLSPFLSPFLFAAAKLLLFAGRIVLNLSTFVLRPYNSLFVSFTIINNFIAMRSGNIR